MKYTKPKEELNPNTRAKKPLLSRLSTNAIRYLSSKILPLKDKINSLPPNISKKALIGALAGLFAFNLSACNTSNEDYYRNNNSTNTNNTSNVVIDNHIQNDSYTTSQASSQKWDSTLEKVKLETLELLGKNQLSEHEQKQLEDLSYEIILRNRKDNLKEKVFDELNNKRISKLQPNEIYNKVNFVYANVHNYKNGGFMPYAITDTSSEPVYLYNNDDISAYLSAYMLSQKYPDNVSLAETIIVSDFIYNNPNINLSELLIKGNER